MRLRNFLVGALFASAIAGCSLGLSPRPEGKDTASSRTTPTTEVIVVPRAAEPPRDLAGVDTSGLADPRKQAFWDVANRLYAPCSDQAVTLVQCVEQNRACAACLPALNLLVSQVDRGVSKAQAAAAVNARFTKEAKEITIGDSPTKGPADAPVTIVVFSDFQCPACKAALPLLDQVIDAHRGKVRLVHKYYPLQKHLRARYAAHAAIAAQKQGKYWEMEKLIFENQEALSDEDLEQYAQKVGLDLVKFRVDYQAPETDAIVARDVQAGDTAGLTHTPFVLINGRLFDPTYFKYDRDLDDWIETEIALVQANKKRPE